MKTTDKIDTYLGEAFIPADPKKKQIFDNYKKKQKEAESVIKSLKMKMRNHQNRFFEQSTLNMAYMHQIEQFVYDLQKTKLLLRRTS